MFPKTMDIDLPMNVDDAVDMLLAGLPLLERSRLANLTTAELDLINRLVGLQIARDLRLWSGNDSLLHGSLRCTG